MTTWSEFREEVRITRFGSRATVTANTKDRQVTVQLSHSIDAFYIGDFMASLGRANAFLSGPG